MQAFHFILIDRKGISLIMVYAVFTVSSLIILFSMYKSGHFCKSFFMSLLQGLSSLFAVNFIGSFISVRLALNLFSTAVSVIAGLPGVIFLLVCDTINSVMF